MNGGDASLGERWGGEWPLRWGPTRIRSKLIFLHTMFSLALAVVMLVVLRPPIGDLVEEAEVRECRLALELFAAAPERASPSSPEGIECASGTAAELGLDDTTAGEARARPGVSVLSRGSGGRLTAARWDSGRGRFMSASVRIAGAREAVNRLYLLLTISLLGVYALIALTLEVFVLPRQVYEPIETLRRADEAVQVGDRDAELIPESQIPRDELGQIMRSRNQSILKLRRQEQALESALQRLEVVAGELKRKNHLLETARRNLADQDRLASLGMMSAGIAHELNTPLAVLKGCVEELAEPGEAGLRRDRVALMLRVVQRLERLSESLLDFARARPSLREDVDLREIVEEAWTLVSMDRDAARVRFTNGVPIGTRTLGDPDRLTQVLVNLLRNAVDAMEGAGAIGVSTEAAEREGRRWVSLSVSDTGPGIEPSLFSRLFEPFASTRLDAHGTGLGLAVADGIVREHGGLLLARNAPEGGAVFEIMLPRGGADAECDGLFDAGGAGPDTLGEAGSAGSAPIGAGPGAVDAGGARHGGRSG